MQKITEISFGEQHCHRTAKLQDRSDRQNTLPQNLGFSKSQQQRTQTGSQIERGRSQKMIINQLFELLNNFSQHFSLLKVRFNQKGNSQ